MGSDQKDENQNEKSRVGRQSEARYVPLPPRLPAADKPQSSGEASGRDRASRGDRIIPPIPRKYETLRPDSDDFWSDDDLALGHDHELDQARSDYRQKKKDYLQKKKDYLERYNQQKITPSSASFSASVSNRRQTLFPYEDEFVSELLWHFSYPGSGNGDSEIELQLPNIIAYFVAVELEPEDSLWDLVILTGNQRIIRAFSCGEYVSKRWPAVSAALEILFNMLGKPEGASSSSLGLLDVTMWLTRESSDAGQTLHLILESSPPLLADVVQAISWLYAAIQDTDFFSVSIDGPPFAFVSLQRINSSSRLTFSIDIKSIVPLGTIDSPQACWLPLCPRYVIAPDHWFKQEPIQETCLQIKFELLCVLAGLEYEETYEDGFALYGALSIVYPVRRQSSQVFWHFQDRRESEEPLSKVLRDFSLDELLEEDQIHFLGLWAEPLVALGSDLGGQITVRPSPAPEIRQSFVMDGITYSATLNPLKVLAIGVSVPYKIVQNRKPIYITNFRKSMRSLRNQTTLLYSPRKKRAWIVSTLSVLLHIARLQIQDDPDAGYNIAAMAPTANGGEGAFQAIIDARQLHAPAGGVPRNPYDNSTTNPVECAVKEVAATLDCAKRKSYRARHYFQNCIVGYELADLVERDTIYLKRQTLDFMTGWTPLLDIVDLALFYEDIFDPIICNPTASSLCPRGAWTRIPCEFNILTASLPCLEKLCERWNPRGEFQYLTKDHRWHNPNDTRDVFFACRRTDEHVCNRLQEVVGREILSQRHISRPSSTNLRAHRNGAVIFRYDLDMTAIKFVLSEASNREIEAARARQRETDDAILARRLQAAELAQSQQEHLDHIMSAEAALRWETARNARARLAPVEERGGNPPVANRTRGARNATRPEQDRTDERTNEAQAPNRPLRRRPVRGSTQATGRCVVL